MDPNKEEDVKLPSKEELLETIEGEEGKQEETTQSEPQYSERETHAMSFGWMPKDKWVEQGGDAEDWRPAKDFLERGEMIGKIRSMTKEVQDTQKAIRHLSQQNTKIYETGYTQAITDLKAERKEALAEGDLVKADEIGDKIDMAKEELAKVKKQAELPKTQQVDPEHVAWVQQNPWYNDPVMMKFADALAREYVHVNEGQVEPTDVRDYVAKTVRKEFAHRFNNSQVRGAQTPDGNGSKNNVGNKSSGSSNLSKIEAEMPEDHRAMMKVILKADPDFKKEDYLKMYAGAR